MWDTALDPPRAWSTGSAEHVVAMTPSPERFDHLLQEKLDELDADAEHQALLEIDPVERLRLRAAYLATGEEGRRWTTGGAVQFQKDPDAQRQVPPVLDIRYPARPVPAPAAGGGAEGPNPRQGRRASHSGNTSP